MATGVKSVAEDNYWTIDEGSPAPQIDWTVFSDASSSTEEEKCTPLKRTKLWRFFGLIRRNIFSTGDTLDFSDYKEKQNNRTKLHQTTPNQDEQIKTKFTKLVLKEIIIYCLYIVFLLIFAFAPRVRESPDETPFYYKQALKSLFVENNVEPEGEHFTSYYNFPEIALLGDVWGFLEGPLLDGLYKTEKRSILFGVPRLRLKRVEAMKGCTIHVDFQTEIKECYADFKVLAEDKSEMTKPPASNLNLTAWKFEDEIRSKINSDTFGTFGTYTQGGYIQNLEPLGADAKSNSKEILAELKANNWIDRGARALFIDFTVYNPSIKLFNVIQLLIEFGPTGKVETYKDGDFKTLRLLPDESTSDKFLNICSWILVAFFVYFFVEEVSKVLQTRSAYFKYFFNWLDMLVLALGVAALVLHFYVQTTLQALQAVEASQDQEKNFIDFYTVGHWGYNFDSCLAFLVLFSWFKFFKFFSFRFPLFSTLAITLTRASKDLLGFFLMFFIVFVAFCELGYLIFGHSHEDFKTFTDTFFTQWRLLLGDFDYSSIEVIDRIMAPIYFFLFLFIIFFVLLNMFIAIICDNFAEVKDDEKKNPDTLVDFNMASHVKKIIIPEKTQKPKDGGNKGVDNNNKGDVGDATPKPGEAREEDEEGVTAEEFKVFEERIKVLQSCVSSLVADVDHVLNKLKKMDQ